MQTRLASILDQKFLTFLSNYKDLSSSLDKILFSESPFKGHDVSYQQNDTGYDHVVLTARFSLTLYHLFLSVIVLVKSSRRQPVPVIPEHNLIPFKLIINYMHIQREEEGT